MAEDGLLGAASLMMFITVAYIGSDMSGVRGRQRGRGGTGSRGQSLIKSQGNNGIPVSVPTSDAATRSAIQSEVEQQPRFCVCLQQMPEPTLSPDWFDMQPTRELSGGQVKEKEEAANSSNFNSLRCKSWMGSLNPFSFQSIIRNELWQTSYSYPFFHLSMALGTMFITTQLTRWFAPIVSSIFYSTF